MVPEVRPWNEPEKTMMFGFPVAALASLTAPSTASAPELLKKNPSIEGWTIVRNFFDQLQHGLVNYNICLGMQEQILPVPLSLPQLWDGNDLYWSRQSRT